MANYLYEKWMKIILDVNTDFKTLSNNDTNLDPKLIRENKVQKRKELKKMKNRKYEDNRK
eukprot:CAMPEP_0116918170 /NCGR_PEP_ID=MMETSP0467-20121206/19603_1 /TAXON_ID=283647 /ORGANISM="Mesodinium pulex, Strain SPMC105" /LENGTH=59 /DNA_ID=CAMNT_0004595451 /DNA_START=467 /DNA_END=649 /DNA_ORIENTATION=-